MHKFIVLALVFVPFLSSAATYHYVTGEGETATVEASSASEALIIAPNIAHNSGVAIDRGDIEEGMEVASAGGSQQSVVINGEWFGFGTGGSNTYHYVTVDGMTATIQANSPTVALLAAPNRAPNSGVAIDDGVIEPGTEVPSVAD